MADPDDDEVDDDTLAAFTKILKKVWPEWSKSHLPSPTPAISSAGLEAFLQTALAEAKETNKSLTERLEAIRDVLTPDQLSILRGLRSPAPAVAAGQGASPMPTTPASDPEPPKPKRKWL